MRALTLDRFDAPPRLRDDLPEPRPSSGDLLVRVHASSVNPSDALIAAGGFRGRARHDFPVTLGRDFAGVVEQVVSASAATRPAMRSMASFSTPTQSSVRAAGQS
jgi:NADPH:quinone reductase-like Zn-dependent oxidoreductase